MSLQSAKRFGDALDSSTYGEGLVEQGDFATFDVDEVSPGQVFGGAPYTDRNVDLSDHDVGPVEYFENLMESKAETEAEILYRVVDDYLEEDHIGIKVVGGPVEEDYVIGLDPDSEHDHVAEACWEIARRLEPLEADSRVKGLDQEYIRDRGEGVDNGIELRKLGDADELGSSYLPTNIRAYTELVETVVNPEYSPPDPVRERDVDAPEDHPTGTVRPHVTTNMRSIFADKAVKR